MSRSKKALNTYSYPNRAFLISAAFRDVRSWHEVLMSFSPYLNVVVGESDSGKSNIVRNIQSVVCNDSAANMIRRGTESCECGLSFFHNDNRIDVTLGKGKSENYYKLVTRTPVSSERFDSVGQSVPEPISRLLRIGEVDLSGESVNFNLATQRGGLFGVDDSPARFARIVGAVSGIENVFSAIRAGTKEAKSYDQESKRHAENARHLKSLYADALKSIDVEKLDKLASQIASFIDKISEKSRLLKECRSLVGEFEGLLRGLEKIERVAGVDVSSFDPAINEVSEKFAHMSECRSVVDSLVKVREQADSVVSSISDAVEKLKCVEDELSQFDSCPLCGGEIR